MTRPDPTSAQYQQAKRLIARIGDLEAQYFNLKRLLPAVQTAADAYRRQRFDRLSFADANNLTGIAELRRRTDADTKAAIDREYHWLLTRMHDGIRPIDGGPRIPPLKIDMHTLSRESRPYLLGPFLDLSVQGAFVSIDLGRSHPEQGRLVYVAAHGAIDVPTIRARLSDIRGWLGAHYDLVRTEVNSFTLQRRDPLPDRIPFGRHFLAKGALFAGIDTTTRQPLHISFNAMTAGTLIPGISGTGKSNALHILLQSFIANLDQFTHVFAIDGKDGVAFNRYRNVNPKLTVLWEEEQFWDLTPKLVAMMRERNARQRDAGIDNATSDYVAIIVDEMSTFTQRPSSDTKSEVNKRHSRFIDDLTILARKGRSTGFRFFYAIQEPNENHIPTSLRANCGTLLSFRLGLDNHATALFGELDQYPADVRKLPRGHALFRDGMTNEAHVVKFPVIP